MLKFKSLSRTPPVSVYVEPTTGYRIPWETSFDDLLGRIRAHKEAHGIQLTEDWKDQVENQLAMTLKADPSEWTYDTEKPYVPRLVAYGRAMWKELHERALAFPEQPDEHDKQAEVKWLEGWIARIPSANCECAYRWAKLGLSFDISSRDAYYKGTVVAHNLVNEKLGKPRYRAD